MESLLNVAWVLVSCALMVGALIAQRRGVLRTSVPVALGCTMLVAVLLFPALSMTDDLQRQRLDVERQGRTLVDTLLLGALDAARCASVSVALLALLMSMALSERAGIALQVVPDRRGKRLRGSRPEAVRPPPVDSFATLFLHSA